MQDFILSCLVFPFGGLEKGRRPSREVGYLGGGWDGAWGAARARRPTFTRFLPSAQLLILLNLSDSLCCVSREGSVLRKRGSQRLVLLAGLAASAEEGCF